VLVERVIGDFAQQRGGVRCMPEPSSHRVVIRMAGAPVRLVQTSCRQTRLFIVTITREAAQQTAACGLCFLNFVIG
jgi:hypothetical protein